MRKYIILFFSVFPFLFACNGNGAPDDIIQKDQMVALLTAVHIADGSLINRSQAPDTLYKYGTARYLALFKKFHTDSAQFRKSYQYYSTKPDEFADMYTTVLKNLQTKNDSINKLLIKQNIARSKMNAPKPNVTNLNGKYGVGLQPQVPMPSHTGSQPKITKPLTLAQIRARRDSLMKIHLKNRHVVPVK